MSPIPPLPHRTAQFQSSAPKIVVEQVGKYFGAGEQGTWALRDLNFTVSNREFVVIVGESGCGKTTLLRLLAGLEFPTTGHIQLDGQRLQHPSQDIGFVFQRPVLLPWRSVLDNVLLPDEISQTSAAEAQRRALELLALFGLGGLCRTPPPTSLWWHAATGSTGPDSHAPTLGAPHGRTVWGT